MSILSIALNAEDSSFGRLVQGVPAAPGFYQRRGKRLFDVFASGIGLLVLSPLFLVVAALIKLTSLGPMIYFQERVGRDERPFWIAKFRSMQGNAEQFGPTITCRGDARITAVGSVLRFLKMDELPQLWNVLTGDMSLVGPRPEVQRYVRTYDSRQKRVLTVRPGITDLASIKYRNEARLLGQSSSPEVFYESVILPHKLDLSLDYLENMSFSYDLLLLAKTVTAMLSAL
ncbi:MAG: sugar transferase [Terriglobales bacterium]|nr:sugar transferase [Terriglobales bacterium]